MKTLQLKKSKIWANEMTKSLRPKMNELNLLVSDSRTAEFKNPKNPGIQPSHSQELWANDSGQKSCQNSILGMSYWLNP